MPKSLSFDLRSRVLATVDAGLSCRQAAARSGVSASGAIRSQALRRAGGDAWPKRQGGDRSRIGPKLIGLDPSSYDTHSLRRTKVALVYKRTGNIRACQLLLGHTKLESTVRYLGIEVDDALILSEQTEL